MHAPLFGGGDVTKTCVAGCCKNGACECRDDHRGELCELEITCSARSDGDWDSTYCDTFEAEVEGQLVLCSCRPIMPGQLAVLFYRVLPDTNLQLTLEGLSTLRGEMGRHALLAVGPVGLYLLLMAVAWRADRACFYLALRPRWMRLWPRRKSLLFFALLRHTVCVYHSLLRVVHVAPVTQRES